MHSSRIPQELKTKQNKRKDIFILCSASSMAAFDVEV